jgi:hypothetical protein
VPAGTGRQIEQLTALFSELLFVPGGSITLSCAPLQVAPPSVPPVVKVQPTRCSTTEHIGWPCESVWIFPVMQGGVMSWPSRPRAEDW